MNFALLILLGLLVVGCRTAPPLPAMAREDARPTATQSEAVIGPPKVPQLELHWIASANADSVEVWATTNLWSWQMVADVAGDMWPFFAAKPCEAFKVRAKNVETYQVISNGVSITRTHTNYSNWCTK